MKFHEFGDKENQHIMLIHGGGNSWWNYLRQAKALSKEYHVILPTLDGHGEEYNTEYVSTIDSAQKLISYINQNCNGQLFLLCGVSLGGQIVIEMLSLKAGNYFIIFPNNYLFIMINIVYSHKNSKSIFNFLYI